MPAGGIVRPSRPNPKLAKVGRGGKSDETGGTRPRIGKGKQLLTSSRRHAVLVTSQSSDGEDGPPGDRTGHHHKRKNRPGKAIKESEEIVGRAVANIWELAWNICAERFFTKSATTTVCVDLRNAWLRIVESEWLDDELFSAEADKIFMNGDTPPLPLAYDSWSRGALELLPGTRRESVMDPFLRNTDDEKNVLSDDELLGLEDGGGSDDLDNVIDDVKVEIPVTAPPTAGYDEWNFELDRQYRHNYHKGSELPLSDSFSDFKLF